MNIPADLKYTGSDEWVRVEGNVAIIGVTDFAQSQLSDIVYFELKVDVGDAVKKNTPVATMESVKAAADVSSPVSGKIVEVNENLSSDFEKINTDPYGAAWMVKVELSVPAEMEGLMNAAAYQKSCEERGH
jgi:glycine cleavage system H protein